MFEAKIADFAVHVLLQSTVLIVIGLLAVRLCGRQKPAVQSAVLRVTLIAVLLCPLVSLTLSRIGVTSYALLPAWEPQQAVQSDNVSAPPMASSLPPEKMTFNSNTEPDGIADTNPFPKTDVPSASVLPVNQSETGIADPSVAGMQPLPHSDKSARFLSFTGWIVSLTWITGMVFLLYRLFRANRQITRLCQNSQPADAETQTLCRETSETLGLNPPEVKISPSVHSPCLIGIWKPVIVLPEQKTLTQTVLRDVFLHELAHLARRDCLFHLLARITTAILFFQPLVWRLMRRLELIADDLCDDYVIQYGSGRRNYANTLVDFAEQLPAPQLAMEAGLAMVSLRSSLSRRIMRIMDSSRSLTLQLPARWVALITILGITATASAALIVNARSESVVERKNKIETKQDLAVYTVPKRIPHTSAKNTVEKSTPVAVNTKKAAATPKSEFRFQGRVVDPNGKPASQATISQIRWDRPTKRILATTDDQGRFDFSIPDSDELYDLFQKGEGTLMAQVEGYGPALKSACHCDTSGNMRKALLELNSQSHAPAEMLEKMRKRILNGSNIFHLVEDDIPLSGRVVNIEGKPVVDAKLQISQLMYQETAGLDDWEKATQTTGIDYYQLRRLLVNNLGNDIGGSTLDYLPTAITDENGQFTLKGLGRDRIAKVLISGPGIATSNVYTRTRKGEIIEVRKQASDPSTEKIVYYPNSFTYVAGPSLPVEGVVRDSKTQKPLSGVTLQSYHLAGRRLSGWTESITRTVSDQQGRYRLEGLPIGKNEVLCVPPLNQPYLLYKFDAETKAGGPKLHKKIDLVRGIWVEGRAYDKITGEPISGGRVEYVAFNDNPFAQTVKKNLGYLTTHFKIQSDGTYRIPALPGRGVVAVLANDFEKYQRGSGAEKIKGKYNQMDAFNTVPHLLMYKNFHIVAEVNPAENAKSVPLDFSFDAGRTLKVKVVDQNGKLVENGQYRGLMEEFDTWNSFKGSELEIRGYRHENPRRVLVFNENSKQVGYLLIDEKNPSDLKITLQPWAEITGRIVDDFGDPKSRVIITDSYSTLKNDLKLVALPPNPEQTTGGSSNFITDENGRFRIVGLIPGKEYSVIVTETVENRPGIFLGNFVNENPIKPGEVRDLGDIPFKPRGGK